MKRLLMIFNILFISFFICGFIKEQNIKEDNTQRNTMSISNEDWDEIRLKLENQWINEEYNTTISFFENKQTNKFCIKIEDVQVQDIYDIFEMKYVFDNSQEKQKRQHICVQCTSKYDDTICSFDIVLLENDMIMYLNLFDYYFHKQ